MLELAAAYWLMGPWGIAIVVGLILLGAACSSSPPGPKPVPPLMDPDNPRKRFVWERRPGESELDFQYRVEAAKVMQHRREARRRGWKGEVCPSCDADGYHSILNPSPQMRRDRAEKATREEAEWRDRMAKMRREPDPTRYATAADYE